MIEQELSVQGDAGKLAGTLCLPAKDGRFPMLLMVNGSGPLDRDSNMPPYRFDVFNTLARHLAERGIASFRYDKRGIGDSEGNYKTTSHYELVADASACFKALCQHSNTDPAQVYVLGYSEGSIIVPQMVLQCTEPVAGLILLTPFIEQGEALLRRQAGQMRPMAGRLKGWKALPLKWYFRLFDPVKAQDKLIRKLHATTIPVIRFGLKKLPAKWLREFMAIEPVSIFRQISTPCLIIGGGKDVQCRPQDVAAIAQTVQGPVETHLLENMTHILRNDPGPASLFSYKKLLKKPVEAKVLTVVSEWVIRHSCSAKGVTGSD